MTVISRLNKGQMAIFERIAYEHTYVDADAKVAVAAFQKGFAEAMLAIHKNNISAAARGCGLHRNNFKRWLQRSDAKEEGA